MASDDGSILLEIPGAWVSNELDPDLSLPAPLTPPSRIQPAYIRTSLNESPTPSPLCAPLPSPSTPIAVHSTPRASYPTLGPRKSDLAVIEATVAMPVSSSTATEVTRQSIPLLFDGASDTSSTFLPSPIGVPLSPLPVDPIETLTEDATSIHSGTTGFSSGQPGSLLSKYRSDSGLSAAQEDRAYKEFSPYDSPNCSVIDTFPSSASINLIPSIPSLAPDLHLHNFPISDGQPLEPHSIYFSAIEGDLSISQGSEDGPEPVHETSTPYGSALELCIPAAEEAQGQIFWQENPSPRRPTARIEVRSDSFRRDGRGVLRQESFTYACKSLPYDAGLRPHAYVDNHEHTTHGKNRLEALAEDLYGMEEFMEEEDHAVGESKRPTIFRKLVERKGILRSVTLNPIKFRKVPNRHSVQSCVTDPQSLTAFSSAENFSDRSPVITNNLNCPSPLPPSCSPIPNKKRPRALFRMTWPGPRPLSMFLVPKPGVDGKVVPSPRELPIGLPSGENTPVSPPTSPQMRDAQIPGTDVHGESYGPSRIAIQDHSPKIPGPSILGRKERLSWLSNIRSLKTSSLVA